MALTYIIPRLLPSRSRPRTCRTRPPDRRSSQSRRPAAPARLRGRVPGRRSRRTFAFLRTTARRMLAGELRPPAEHEVVRRVLRIPARQAVGYRRADARLLEKCPCPSLMAKYGRRPGPRLDDIVGRVDRGHGSIVKRHPEPQVHAIELRVPFGLHDVPDRRIFGRQGHGTGAGRQHQHEDEKGTGFHLHVANRAGAYHALAKVIRIRSGQGSGLRYPKSTFQSVL